MPAEERQYHGVNAALICEVADRDFIRATICPLMGEIGACVLSDDPAFISTARAQITIAEAGLDRTPIDGDAVLGALRARLAGFEAPYNVVVDMSWGIQTIHGVSGIETWGAVAEAIAAELGVKVISVYNREVLIEEQMQAAFRAHKQFAAPSGIYENPWWLPVELSQGGTADEQMAFLLGRVVPDYAIRPTPRKADRHAARGADPHWLGASRSMGPTPGPGRWHVHCLGPLRVYLDGHRRVDWKLPGGSVHKTRALFAYLLHAGEKGASADRIGELLWPEGGTEATKRARLHHAVAMLRKTLGDKDAVIRAGEYYRLNAPPGSWVDITSFEQLCRRAVGLQKAGEDAEALKILRAAARLYEGDLFEDMPAEYVETEVEDWVAPRRTWLREMAIKVERDSAATLRRLGKPRQALEHCQRALALDPLSEPANAEALRVFAAQGRLDAAQRQYKRYIAAMEAEGVDASDGEVAATWQEMLEESL